MSVGLVDGPPIGFTEPIADRPNATLRRSPPTALGRQRARRGHRARIVSKPLVPSRIVDGETKTAVTRGLHTGTVSVDGVPVFVRRRLGEGAPVVLPHGNPTNTDDWLPFLERLRGPAIAFDWPGFGRSARPSGFDHSMHGWARFFDRFLEAVAIGEHSLVTHDWGGAALIAAQRAPERLRRLVVINSVPLLPGYRWHWIARLWRRPLIGEIVNELWTRRGIALVLRQGRGGRGPLSDELVDTIWEHFDSGTKRAILSLYRSAPEHELAAAGAGLHRLRCPALVVWGGRDPYLPPELGPEYADRLPNAELLELPEAGHWPWLDEPTVIDRVVDFLEPPA